MKKLLIETCEECPFITHGGGFAQISYIPKCLRNQNKILPYTEHASKGRITARVTNEIPDWCKLEDEK